MLSGLRRRSTNGAEKPDWGARVALFGIPAVVATALIATQTIANEAEMMLAAAALLVGALLAGFAQVAAWRERILTRGRKVDAVRIRALNEAGALILMSIHVSVGAAVAVFILALMDTEDVEPLTHWIAVTLGAAGPAALAYVALSLIFVANLLWDGFVNEEADNTRENLSDFE
ncbi:hypothetical protein BMW26_00970 [Microbacterium sp. 1.5R]|uniref:hypothetical protein n=1 Tax=Microbacterium sp. 1.5R TaxID=1916917 RepID=UPI00090B4A6C|nr:hypothetical protein [Microbacterium sp. 1.5R]APH43684.1 hypothetical protein BMW26_00970 [Microbacterium sp. 1.5R]